MGKRLLVIADSPTCNTGFGIVTQNVLGHFSLQDWDIHILAINYYGDPHDAQKRYKLYSPSVGGDVYGFGRLNQILHDVQPECIFIINDVWLCSEYTMRIRKLSKDVPIVIYTPVDSPGIKPEFVQPINAVNHVVSYTEWGLEELRKSGYTGSASVLYHGVNPGVFYSEPQNKARALLFDGVSQLNDSTPFIVLYNARNQPRKRIDLFLWTVAKWLEKYPHENVYAHYHGAARGDLG